MHILDYLYSEALFWGNRSLEETSEELAEQATGRYLTQTGMTAKPRKPASKPMWQPEGKWNVSIIHKCHNIGKEEGACRKREPTHTSLPAWRLKQTEANWYGIQRGKTADGCRKECAESFLKKQTKNIRAVQGRKEATMPENKYHWRFRYSLKSVKQTEDTNYQKLGHQKWERLECTTHKSGEILENFSELKDRLGMVIESIQNST